MISRKHHLFKKKLFEQKKHAGLVSEHFPTVTNIVINMKYYWELSNRLFLKRTVSFYPSSCAYFFINCLTKNCDGKCFKFKPVINTLIKNHKDFGGGNMFCRCKNNSIASDYVSIAYKINIKYRKCST